MLRFPVLVFAICLSSCVADEGPAEIEHRGGADFASVDDEDDTSVDETGEPDDIIDEQDPVDDPIDEPVDETLAIVDCETFLAANPPSIPVSSSMINGHCYIIPQSALNFQGSANFCNNIAESPTYLVEMDSIVENLLVTQFAAEEINGNRFWIGFHDQDMEGDFITTRGAPISIRYFSDGEPNNFGAGEDCLEISVANGIDSDGRWNDQRCRQQIPFVCEIEIPQE